MLRMSSARKTQGESRAEEMLNLLVFLRKRNTQKGDPFWGFPFTQGSGLVLF